MGSKFYGQVLKSHGLSSLTQICIRAYGGCISRWNCLYGKSLRRNQLQWYCPSKLSQQNCFATKASMLRFFAVQPLARTLCEIKHLALSLNPVEKLQDVKTFTKLDSSRSVLVVLKYELNFFFQICCSCRRYILYYTTPKNKDGGFFRPGVSRF